MTLPLVIAHRGASAYARENTLEAFEKAIALSADGVEFDVWSTQDGVLVVYHNAQLGGRLLSTLTYGEIQTIDPTIPTFEAVLQCCKDRILMDVEIKAPGYEAAVVGLLEPTSPETVVVTSFVPDVLHQVRALNPILSTGLLLGSQTLAIAKSELKEYAKALGVTLLAPHWSLLDDATFVAHLPDLPLWVWTVNEPDLLIPLASNKRVAGLVTDYPDLARRWIQPP
jgi:glycerophosphoryl diester phosphodiesterase